jgi:3-oxoadipate enol-lactonase
VSNIGALAFLEQLDPAGQAIVEEMRRGSPELVDWLVDALYGKLYQRKQLDLRTRLLLTVACVAGTGSMQPQVAYQSRLALLNGVSIDELYEVCFHVAIFAGFANAMNAMNTIRGVHESLASSGDQ